MFRLFKAKAFWVWTLILLSFCVAYVVFLPTEIQMAFCDVYAEIEEPLVHALEELWPELTNHASETLGEGAMPTSQPTDVVSASISSPEGLSSCIRGLLCDSATKEMSDTGPSLARVIRVAGESLPLAMAISFIICLFSLPSRRALAATMNASKTVDDACGMDFAPRHDSHDGTPTCESAVAGLRTRQTTVALLYAMLSGFFTSIVPPNFGSQEFLADPQNLAHMFMMIVAAGAAATFVAARTALIEHHKPVDIAFFTCVGGVFIGGLIALCIAIPYRLTTPVPEARLELVSVAKFSIVRLALLPAAAGLCGLATVHIVRAWLRRRTAV